VVDDDAVKLEELLASDDDALAAELGRLLVGVGVGFGPAEFGRFRRIAQEWLDEHADELRDRVCDNSIIQAITTDDLGTKLTELSVIADALVAITQDRPSALVVTVIVARRGFRRFCYGPGA
jgi:hypothetical protein